MFKFFAIFLQSFERPSKISNKLEILIPFLKLKKTFFFLYGNKPKKKESRETI